MKNIGIIGTGNIGTHLLKLMCRNNAQNYLTIADVIEEKAEDYAYKFGIEANTSQELIESSDFLFLTVKPDQISSVCQEINHYTQDGRKSKLIIVSAAAGVPISKLDKWTLNQHHIVRCMPNIPISISEGSILWYTAADLDPADKELFAEITEGPLNMWVAKEELIDSGTILSGCSPAYLAKIYQTYIEMGKELGFTQAQSRQLLHNSFEGTIKLLLDNSPQYLMDQVASKGGATERSLEIMDQHGLSDIIKQSVDYSMERIKSIRDKV